MDASTYSAIAAAISAACALFTLYMFREQGKGFVWTKDHKVKLATNENGDIHLEIEIPLYNLGKGNIRFLGLKVKKINLKTKAMENYSMDMDEAYFPEGVPIIIYRVAIQSFLDPSSQPQLVIASDGMPDEMKAREQLESVNKHISEIPEHIIILKCRHKDGSWFGKREKETVIGLSITGLNINFLSIVRRHELKEYFAW